MPSVFRLFNANRVQRYINYPKVGAKKQRKSSKILPETKSKGKKKAFFTKIRPEAPAIRTEMALCLQDPVRAQELIHFSLASLGIGKRHGEDSELHFIFSALRPCPHLSPF